MQGDESNGNGSSGHSTHQCGMGKRRLACIVAGLSYQWFSNRFNEWKAEQAEKEAAANVILRREETAATRSLANTARVMSENPMLQRLKELETLKEMADRIGEVRVVVGSDGLEKLLPSQLLGEKRDS